MRVAGERVGASTVGALVVVPDVVGVDAGASILLRDTFGGDTLSSAWTLTQGGGDSCTAAVDGGELVMTVTAGGVGQDLWFNGDEGPLLAIDVDGDFEVIATLRVRNGDDSGPCPSNDGAYRQFGVSMQDPDRTLLNYVSLSIGDSAAADLRCEWKTTVDSVSVFDSISAPSGAGQIRCRRTWQVFDLHYRATAGSSWTLVQSIDRTASPMPAVLAVGLIVYASTADPDITGYCDAITIAAR